MGELKKRPFKRIGKEIPGNHSIPAGGRQVKRDIGIDYLRSGVTVTVVAHHAALAYNTFSHYNPLRYTESTAPVVDTVRFFPFDVFVAWNDIFFMSLMFLISGLFVAPSITRKGVGQFLTDRTKRLGIPFIISVTLLSPAAYYPSWLLSDSAGQGGFLGRFFTVDGWPPGPAWFISVLLLFCIVAATAHHYIPTLMRKLSWSAESAGSLVVVFLAVSLATTIPMHLLIGPNVWFGSARPFWLPASRVLLYFAWFLLGVALGSANAERSLSRENLRLWPLWLAIGGLGYLAHAMVTSGAYLPNAPAWVVKVMSATAFSFCCTFTSLAAIGLARSFFRNNRSPADHFSGNAYGVYVFHYGFVIWLQFSLLALPIPAAVKFLITLSVALAASWFLTALLRKTAAKKIL